MSNELHKPTKIVMGIISLGCLFALATVPSSITETNDTLDRLNGMSQDEIKTAYADRCVRHEARKNFEAGVKALKADGPRMILVSADQNPESLESCPNKVHAADIGTAQTYQVTNWGAGGTFAIMGLLTGYIALGGRKKEAPKP